MSHHQAQSAVAAYNLIWPEDWRGAQQIQQDALIFDLIEFTYEHVALPEAYALAGLIQKIRNRARTRRAQIEEWRLEYGSPP